MPGEGIQRDDNFRLENGMELLPFCITNHGEFLYQDIVELSFVMASAATIAASSIYGIILTFSL